MKTFINPRRISPIYKQEWLAEKEKIRRITKKEWLEIFPTAEVYLENNLIDNIERLDKLTEMYSKGLDSINTIENEDLRDFGINVVDCFIGDEIKTVEKRIKVINQYISPDIPTAGRLTHQDIESAKECDWENLIKPVRRYKENHFTAICPFHGDKDPSFLVKNGFGYCFGCGWSGDSIKFLMELENISFVETVKKLK